MAYWFRVGSFALALVTVSSLATAQTVGQPVALAWDPNAEPTVIGYRVYIGAAPSVYSQIADAGNATTFTFRNGVAGHRYYFAVTAYTSDNLESPRSSEVSTVIASSTATPPDGGTPPSDEESPGLVLDAPVITGQSVAFAWRPVGPLNAIEYLLEVGSTPGSSTIYNASVGAQTSFSVTLQQGSYFARVRARLPDEESVVSNEVGFSIGEGGCKSIPKTVTDISGTVAAGVATITWKPAARATSYIVQVGSAPGSSDLFNRDVGAVRSVTANVSTRSPIYLRVIAVNACGQSAASGEIRMQ